MTIYDIAKEANVSASTVSRVINKRDGISAETREKVEALLRKYNFSPDVVARGLVMQSTKMIGILMEDLRVVHHTESAYLIERAMTSQGYCVITMSTGSTEEEKANYIKILGERRVEGVILMGSAFESENVKLHITKHLAHVPVVIVNGYLDLPNVSGVIVDEFTGVENCVKLLHQKGFKQIGFCLAGSSPSGLRKRNGYMSGMLACGAKSWELLVFQYESAKIFELGYQRTKEILNEHPTIEAMIYSDDLIAVGGLKAALEMGRAVPSQFSIIGINNNDYCEICTPTLSTLDNRLVKISEMAADILINQLREPHEGKKLEIETRIIERETT